MQKPDTISKLEALFTNEQFALPPANPYIPPLLEQRQDDKPTEPPQKAEEAILKVSNEQHDVCNEIVGSVLQVVSKTNLDVKPAPQRANMQRLSLVDAPSAARKTSVTSAIQRYIMLKGLRVLTVASSAAAAQLLDGGQTTHSS